MTFIRYGRNVLVTMIAPIMLACSGDGSTGPEGCDDCGIGEVQSAVSTINTTSATLARGGTMNVTVTYVASSGLTIGGFHTQTGHSAIAVNQISTSGSGNTITRQWSITPGATVPPGNYVLRFWITVNGATNTVQTTRAELNLNVT